MMNEVYKAQQLSLPEGTALTIDDIVSMITWMAPMASVLMVTFSSVVNLYLAGKVVQKSGKLQRPWPNLHQLTLSARCRIHLFGWSRPHVHPEWPAPDSGANRSNCLCTAVLLVGLSVLHYLTRQSPARLVILWTTYFLLAIFQWIGIVLVLLGGAEIFFNVRSRLPRGPLGPNDQDKDEGNGQS